MDKIKKFLKDFSLTKNLYQWLKKSKQANNIYIRTKYHGTFYNRIKNHELACIVLAGYKEFFYDSFFGRLKAFAPADIDIIVISSGKYLKTLDEMCEENGWSYLSTKENNVALVQNVAISKLKQAKYIFKLDEDILLTEGYFEKMKLAYEHAWKHSEYRPGVIAPLIPINGYAHMRVLEKLKLKEIYEEKFERPLYSAGSFRQIENNPEVAKFFWGEGGFVPGIDELNRRFSVEKIEERPCPIRFSIGAIMFEREFFENMGMFRVKRSSNQMGADEEQICAFAIASSRPIMVSENIVVGHLSFGPQNVEMKKYYEEHKSLFMPLA